MLDFFIQISVALDSSYRKPSVPYLRSWILLARHIFDPLTDSLRQSFNLYSLLNTSLTFCLPYCVTGINWPASQTKRFLWFSAFYVSWKKLIGELFPFINISWNYEPSIKKISKILVFVELLFVHLDLMMISKRVMDLDLMMMSKGVMLLIRQLEDNSRLLGLRWAGGQTIQFICTKSSKHNWLSI